MEIRRRSRVVKDDTQHDPLTFPNHGLVPRRFHPLGRASTAVDIFST